MLKFFFIIILLLTLSINLSAQIENAKEIPNNQMSIWKGFNRHDFEFEQRATRLIVPDKPLPGNPWVWRARFPDWHTEVDSILVAEGFHLAYINTNDQFGSPKALVIWDKLYAYLTENLQLQKRVALVGVSRGGLFVYNWAKKNTDKVACIYAEAPVCDFKSWPAGFGKSKGSQEAWKILKNEYGFSNNAAAKQYDNNPIDNLETLANAKIPILHTIGLEDNIVPPEENTYLLVNKYIRLGGMATVIPCTQYPQKLEGHHFPIETPRIVADFIKYNTVKFHKLNSSNYHDMLGNLSNAKQKFEEQKKGRVAFLGGSITYNPGWRDSVCSYLRRRFPATQFEFVAAGISSMGTTPAAFRLERDVLSRGEIDLLFEEAAVNDATNDRTDEEQIRGMEGIVRKVKKANPKTDIIIMHFVDPEKMTDYRNGKVPNVIRNHDKVAHHYNISTIDLAREVTDRIDNGEFSWKDDFKDLHPSPFGQIIYANSIIQFLENAFANTQDLQEQNTDYQLPGSLDSYSYDNGYLIDISMAKTGKGWEINPLWNPKDGTRTRANYVDAPMLISNNPGSALKLEFEGSAVGIAVAAGQDAGKIKFRIDKKDWTSLNLFTTWSGQVHLPWYYTLASELKGGKHLLELKIADENDKRSKGNACRIRYFFANR